MVKPTDLTPPRRNRHPGTRWDEQNALLVESHERVIGELTEEYEVRRLGAARERERERGRERAGHTPSQLTRLDLISTAGGASK